MFPRKITSLQEDMQKLGLAGLVNEDINGKARKPMTEAKKPSPKSAQQLAEAKKSIAAQRKRASVIREGRMAKKLAFYETRLQRIERAAKKSGTKIEFKLRMLKGLTKRAAVMESYDVKKALGTQTPTADQMSESFMKVAGLAGALARNFSVLEHYYSEAEATLGIPVMHPGSAYGYDTNVSNAADSDASGEVTDYAKAGKAEDDDELPKDDMAEAEGDDDEVKKEDEDDDKDPLDAMGEDDEKDGDEVKEDDDSDEDDKLKEAEGDDDEVKEDDEKDGDDDDLKEDDDEDKKAADKKVERRKKRARSEARGMDFELHAIRVEAEEQAAAVGEAENVNMGYASSLMNDMVSYLGGAMKLYFKLQQSMKSMGYVGQDQPVGTGAAPTEVPTNPAVIGQGQPEGQTAVDQGGVSNAPKTGDATDTAGVEAPKAESKKK